MSTSEFYTDAQRAMQDRFEARPLADRLEAAIVADELNEQQIAFISSRDFFYLATVNAEGEPTVSHKGGDVGQVKVIDPKHLAFPLYDGNGMFLSAGNVSDTGKVGMLFIDYETPNRVRVQGEASIQADDPLIGEWPGAKLVVRVEVSQAFINCARYIPKYTRVEPSPYVPDENGEQPYATWKRIDDLQDVLPPEDRGRAEDEGGIITEREYGKALMRGES
jgi:predicted pyridoxine 5'-phosphate oxidase superfamily flavin-nucleotide-binding protein